MSHAPQLYIRLRFSNLREIIAARGIDKILGIAVFIVQHGDSRSVRAAPSPSVRMTWLQTKTVS